MVLTYKDGIFCATPIPKKSMEPLLSPEEKRYTLHPIRHPRLFDFYEKHESAFWKVSEVDLSSDLVHWEKRLTPDEKRFVSHVLAFFASSDGIVQENLAERFGREVQILEAKFFYSFQSSMENIHSRMYSTLITTYVSDEAERQRLFTAATEMPCVKRKADWALRWIESPAAFATRLVAFAAVEGVFFSASFCAIFWLKKRGLMPGLAQSNILISRDEGLHQDFACFLYREYLVNKLSDEQVHDIVGSAVAEEDYFCTEALPVSLIGMNADSMRTYIRFVADRLLTQLGHPKLYHAANPFDWMALQGLEHKENFFETRVTDYQLAKGGHVFDTAADF